MQSSNTTSTEMDGDLASQNSQVPILGESFSSSENSPQSTLPSVEKVSQGEEGQTATSEKDSKSKRRFWQLGKKKDDKGLKKTSSPSDQQPTATSSRSMSPMASPPAAGVARAASPQIPSSPSRGIQSSPRLHSPASSQIFERNVQEEIAPIATSPAIPSHISTENHIPPVLDASSMAITDDHLTPDTVEIVTHAAHQPAAVTVTNATSHSNLGDSTLSSPVAPGPGAEELSPHIPPPLAETANSDTASTYAALDSADVRRLSFISFADVVHAEHAQAEGGAGGSMRDSFMLSGASSMASPNPIARSPSPVRSPISPLSASGGGSPTFQGLGLEGSPGKGGMGSPKGSGDGMVVQGELAIETMSHALRKMESGDLGSGAGTTGKVSVAVGHEG